MNELLKNIYERRAVRKYKNVPVAKEVIDQLIAAGCMAPSAMNRQPWKFYILTDSSQVASFSKQIAQKALGQMKRLSIKEAAKMTLSFFHLSKVIDFIKTQDHVFYGAPAVIFITSPRKDEWGSLDVGMCAQNIMLAAKALGLDTCPVGFARFVMQTKDYFTLNIPATEQVELAIIVGFGDERPKPHNRVENNVVYI
jgi:nitroreductase